MGTAVRRHRLDAIGNGKARRYPRATVEALQDRLRRGASVETTNQYLAHAKAFFRSMVRDHRAADSPLSHLEAGNAELDRRHDRRELYGGRVAPRPVRRREPANPTFRGLKGWDRFHLYATACGTGFRGRPGEPDAGDFRPRRRDAYRDAIAAGVTNPQYESATPAAGRFGTAARLSRGKPASPPCGAGHGRDGKAAEMLRIDLEAAGIPYAVEGPDGPLYADFHSLRHTYLTLGGRAGIDLRTLQELAGHAPRR